MVTVGGGTFTCRFDYGLIHVATVKAAVGIQNGNVRLRVVLRRLVHLHRAVLVVHACDFYVLLALL